MCAGVGWDWDNDKDKDNDYENDKGEGKDNEYDDDEADASGAGALFGRSIPGRIDRFIRENSSTSLRHCRPCPGVTVIKLKVARSPFRLR